jgi:hypothetical protein
MGNNWGYACWTPEGKRHYEKLQKDRDQTSYEYDCAYGIVRAAMALFGEPDLQTLKNAMYFAHCFLDEELDEMSDEELKAFGLDVWIAKQKEAEELEEQVRLDQEEEEREQLEEEERLEAVSRSSDSDSA